jgi:very-short-patch-repair endonuclease
MRRAPTEAEALLWSALRRRQLGRKFRRQHVIAGYIVDFYCAALALALEVDGELTRIDSSRTRNATTTSLASASTSCASTTSMSSNISIT